MAEQSPCKTFENIQLTHLDAFFERWGVEKAKGKKVAKGILFDVPSRRGQMLVQRVAQGLFRIRVCVGACDC